MDLSTLFITDLDGTLLDREGELSTFTISVINHLIEKGYNFTIATARAPESTVAILQSLNLKLPVILHNGVSIYDPVIKKYIFQKYIPLEDVNQILDIYYKRGLNPLLYALNENNESKVYYTEILNEGERKYIESRLMKGDSRFKKVKLLPRDNTKVFEINIVNRKEKLEPVYNEIRENFNVFVYFMDDIYTLGYYWLEITHHSGTKEKAIKDLKNMLNIEKVICFGDSTNDISMFKVADECYAMENAHEDLKKISTKVIKSNEENGVAQFLKEYLNLDL